MILSWRQPALMRSGNHVPPGTPRPSAPPKPERPRPPNRPKADIEWPDDAPSPCSFAVGVAVFLTLAALLRHRRETPSLWREAGQPFVSPAPGGEHGCEVTS